MKRFAGGLAIGCSLGSCALEPVDIEVVFPSTHAFVLAENARVTVYDVGGSIDGTCADILQNGGGEHRLENDSGFVPVCGLAGGVTFDEVKPGAKAFVVQVTDADDIVIFEGCSIAEVYAGAPAIIVDVSSTEAYDPDAEPVCESAEAKCYGECS